MSPELDKALVALVTDANSILHAAAFFLGMLIVYLFFKTIKLLGS